MARLIQCHTILGDDLESGKPPIPPSGALVNLFGSCADGRASMSVTREQLSTHWLLVGAAGCGKTNCIREAILQIKRKMGPKDSMLVFDPKGDFLSLASSHDHILSCFGDDAGWNLFGEVTSDGWSLPCIEANAHEIADTVFAESIESSSQPFFPKAARDIFAALLSAIAYAGADDRLFRLAYLNNKTLRAYLRTLSAKRLADFLSRVPSLAGVLAYVGNGSSDQALGVIAELEEAVNRLFMGNFGGVGAFSIRRMQRARAGMAAFVEYDPANGSSPAYQVLVDLYLKEALAMATEEGDIYLVLDELKMLPRLGHLEDALTFGRSKGVKIIAGLQSMEQLFEVYGEYGGRNLASGFQTISAFHTNNAATRAFVQGVLGSSVKSISYLDPSGKSTAMTHEGSVVEDWDFTGLRCGQAIVSQPYCVPYRFSYERY